MVKYCTKCGFANSDKNDFCSKCGNSLRNNGNNSESNNMNYNREQDIEQMVNFNKKDPWVSVILSLIIPGLGFLYISNIKKFLMYFLIFIVLVYIFNPFSIMGFFFYIFWIIFMIVQCYDAYKSTHKVNLMHTKIL